MSSTIIPAHRYADAPAGIEFLITAFGFDAHMVVEGEEGIIEHAQLGHGTGMLMLGSARNNEFGRLLGSNVAAHAERARAAGAEILTEPEDQDYGGSSYVVRDPEGHLRSFGDHSPWAGD